MSATEKELSALHNKVAKALSDKLESADTAGALLEEFRDELPEEVIKYLAAQSDASPALLTVITRFLKDNSITAVIEENEELTALDKQLAEKRKRRVGRLELVDTDELYD